MAHTSKRKSMSAGWGLWVLMLLTLVIPGIAWAGAGFGPVDCADKSVSTFLVPLFDSLFSECGGSKGAFEGAIGILNSGALMIGGMLAAYTLVAGTMQTAHDGEMLGKKWSSMWLPIRTVLGIGLTVPINGGFCTAQLLVAFLIGQGVHLADAVWSGYLTSFSSPAGMAPKAMLPNVADLARGMLSTQLCLESYNALREGGAGNTFILDTAMAGTSPASGARNYGVNGGSECGSVFYEQSPLSHSDPAFGIAETSFDTAPLSAVQQAHMSATVRMEQSLGAVAKLVVTTLLQGGQPPDVGVALHSAVVEYQAAVAGSADAVFGSAASLNTFVTAAKTDGWYMAGTYFMKMTQMQDAVNQVVAHTPTAVVPNKGVLQVFGSDFAPFYSRLEGLLRDSSQNQTIKPSTANAIDQIGNSSSPFQKAVQSMMNTIFGGNWIASIAPANSNRSALMQVKDFGDYVMTGAEAGMALGAGLSLFNSTVGNWVMLISAAVLIMSASIAVYLPMAPFLIYFGAFVGWIILCAEAVFAAPLWAVMHLSPSGDDVMGSAKAGYMMLLGVLLRPALIVMGFIFALIASEKLVGAFNQIFFPAFKMAMVGSIVGLGTSVVMIGIYFGALVMLFHTIFGLIHVIPDKLLRWIGGGHEQLGETSKGMSQAGHSAHQTTIASIRTIQQQGGLGGLKGRGPKGGGEGGSGIGGGSRNGGGSSGQDQEWSAKVDGPGPEMTEKFDKVATGGAKNLAAGASGGGAANPAGLDGGKDEQAAVSSGREPAKGGVLGLGALGINQDSAGPRSAPTQEGAAATTEPKQDSQVASQAPGREPTQALSEGAPAQETHGKQSQPIDTPSGSKARATDAKEDGPLTEGEQQVGGSGQPSSRVAGSRAETSARSDKTTDPKARAEARDTRNAPAAAKSEPSLGFADRQARKQAQGD